ncbi:DUF1302 family protein [Solimonas sp. K1W22B-7]|uniref:DUF1302 domain-containing protein n=1 Tax=Solimonas sp. K1W22B-7 TaxID=2303331 RepID=UPI000E332E40|nr:DUF1302 family protein [Solimonas sp. K1W22B-7]AXQ30638.1 DUF1302 family protein [Solimonas sp. K1W22B-7]
MMEKIKPAVLAAALLLPLFSPPAAALSFDLDEAGEWNAVLNTTVTAGAAWRMQNRASDLVGKSNLDPNVCGRTADGRTLYQVCQGLFRTQTFPAAHLAAAPGQFTVNADDGNLNYDRYDVVQAPLKITQDFTLTHGDFGLFLKGLYFYDFVNNDFTERHPNRITPANMLDVGVVSTPGHEVLPLPVGLSILPLTQRSDSVPCPAARNPGGGPCGLVYGPGGVVREKRSDGETLRQIGTDLQLLDAYVYGKLPLWGDKEVSLKLGRQSLNWGESTLLVFGSINQVNPVNANNFYRTGFLVEEVFQPVGLLSASMELFDGATLEMFYQYEWLPLEAPAPGSYFSFLDVGTNNAIDWVNLSFGSAAEDPESVGRLLDSPLSGITNTSLTAERLRDKEPDGGGQYGAALKYYSEEFNAGTEFGFYFMNYHARNPYVSVISVDQSCGKNVTNTVGFILACPDIPLLHTVFQPNDPNGTNDSAVPFDSLKVQLEYPENIKLFGVSFNTTLGDFSLQGEVAYRPDEPLQVDLEDLVFAGFGPTLSNCHVSPGCAGSGSLTGAALGVLGPQFAGLIDQLVNVLGVDFLGGIGANPDGTVGWYPGSDYVDANGNPGAYSDTFDLIIGHLPGAGRAFPSFIIPYRGGVVGSNPGNSYIRGWETFDTYQFNLGATHVAGATDNPFGADQVITLLELGATWVPGMPDLDRLQLEAPGTYTHASAGADGSGANGSRQACSTNVACSYGPDGLRFNPHQQDLGGLPDKLSWGYVIISQVKYESVAPGISLMPQLTWKHDVNGTAPGLATNFVAGRKSGDLGLEIRYKSSLAFNLGYTWFTGGGPYNLYRDRDTARAYVRLQF